MHHDTQLRDAARAIYEAVYPGEEWSPLRFEDAERFGSVHYRNAVDAARKVRLEFAGDLGARQLGLF